MLLKSFQIVIPPKLVVLVFTLIFKANFGQKNAERMM